MVEGAFKTIEYLASIYKDGTLDKKNQIICACQRLEAGCGDPPTGDRLWLGNASWERLCLLPGPTQEPFCPFSTLVSSSLHPASFIPLLLRAG